ncbi:MAG: apolipoprotein N-acyltransferase [Bacteroidota bacterium]
MKRNIALGIAGALLLVAAIVAYDMYRLSAQELLWGYRTLWLLLSAWGGLVLLGSGWLAKENTWRWLGLSAGSSVLLGIGFPDIIPVPWLLFVGFVPLLIVESEARQQGKRWGVVYWYAYQTFVLWNIIATYWVSNSSLGAGTVAILANSFLMCIPFILFHHTAKNAPRLAYGSFVFYWITFEYLHQNWDLTWPWLTLGNGFAEYYHWVQWYEYTGVFGGSLWVLVANVLVFHLFTTWRKNGGIAWSKLMQLGSLIIVPIVGGMIWYYNYQEQGTPSEVVVVQPNYEPHYVKFRVPESKQIEEFIQLSKEKMTDATAYLVFPESSFGYVEIDELSSYRSIRKLKAFLADYPNVQLVTGANAYNVFEENEPHSEAVRSRQGRNGKMIYFETINAALQINSTSDSIPLYRKSKLVPGPEIFPFKKLFFFLKPLVESIGGTTAGIATQKQRSVFASAQGRVAPIICYESVFGEFHAGYVRKGAQAGFIMTNDGWWDNTAGHRQHLRFASLRAIETRRSIARSANTGISAFVNQRGDILQATDYDEPIAIRDTILMNDRITFYVIWGDMIARLSMFISILFVLNAFAKGWMGRVGAK